MVINIKTYIKSIQFKQCIARSSFETTWWYLKLIFKLTAADISWKYHQIVSNEDRERHCFNNEITLGNIKCWHNYCFQGVRYFVNSRIIDLFMVILQNSFEFVKLFEISLGPLFYTLVKASFLFEAFSPSFYIWSQ